MKPVDSSLTNMVEFLHRVPLFAECPSDALAELAAASRVRRVPKGSVILYQNDPSDAAYIVRSGSVTILLACPDGRELVINEMRPGDCFGELALITGAARSSSAVAREESELLVVPQAAFLALLYGQASVQRHLLELLAQRLSASSERESALAFLDAPARLARVLLQMDALSEDGYVTVSQAELAQRTGLTRQTVAKSLGRWRRSGWLVTGRGRVMLLNRDALAREERQA